MTPKAAGASSSLRGCRELHRNLPRTLEVSRAGLTIVHLNAITAAENPELYTCATLQPLAETHDATRLIVDS